MVTEIWVNIRSGNVLLPDGTKPLPEPMLTDLQWSPSDIHIRENSQEMPQPSITKIHLKITYLNFYSDFPGANELTTDEYQAVHGNMDAAISYVKGYGSYIMDSLHELICPSWY